MNLIAACNDVKVYVGDSSKQALVREQEPDDIILTNSSEFDDYFCVSSDDLATLMDKCNNE